MSQLAEHPFLLLLVQAVAVIATSRLLGLVARRIGQPMVIAEVVAGIVLGPSVLGWLWPEASAAFFPASSLSVLSMLSQVGLVLFMFLIGLELDPSLLKGRGRASVAISHSSIVVPFALGALLALKLYPEVSTPSVPFASFTLFMGVAMSITAFPVLARILTERRLLRSHVGAVTIACAAVDDVTAWCILAFVVSIVRATGLGAAVLTTVLALAYVGFMFFAVRPFLERLAARATGGDAMPQNVVAAAFVLLFLSSATTELIGIHGLFGAFLFGAIVPRRAGFARALAEKLEDVVLVFLLPLFFAVSGLRTELGLLDSARSWALCGLVVAVAVAGKFGGSFFAARLTGMSWRESGALGVLMNTRGLMELIVLNIGLDLGVISPTLFTMMVVMALATTFMTTPILNLIYPVSLMQREAAAETAGQAAPPRERGHTTLLCLSQPRASPGMAALVTALTRGSGTAAKTIALRLLTPPDRTSMYVREPAAEASRADEAPDEHHVPEPLALDDRRAGFEQSALSFVSTDPALDICRVAELRRAQLVILGAHVPLLSRTVLGGTVHDVLGAAPVTVGVFVDRGLRAIRKVLVPYRGSQHERAAMDLARRVSLGTGAIVTVLAVSEPATAGATPRLAAAVEEDMVASFGTARHEVRLESVVADDPASAVVEEAHRGYDLVVVGIGRGWGLEHRQFGLFPQRLVQDTEASLLVVRHAAHEAAAADGELRADGLFAAAAGAE